MVIIKHYRLERKDNSDFFYVRSRESAHCPWCEGGFQVIGSRKRILYRQDASVADLIIRRLKCTDCGRISHELPDIIVPYKRHESATISQALEEQVPSRQDSYCENSTILRWKLWFFLLHDYLQSTVHALMELWHCAAFVKLPLYPLKYQADGWLKLLVRNLVNSGRWLQTCSA